jgi:circadian clock protein KaiC
MSSHIPRPGVAATGVGGLDAILGGGLPRQALYLIQGHPGSGKTLLGIQFLVEGAAKNEPILYVTAGEGREHLERMASSHGLTTPQLPVHEFQPHADKTHGNPQESLTKLEAELERVRPVRVVFDALSDLRRISGDASEYRENFRSLRRMLIHQRATALLLDSLDHSGDEVTAYADGVIRMETRTPTYGDDRRRLRVVKMRSIPFLGGFHDYRIRTGEIAVFPRIVVPEPERFATAPLSSGMDEVDALIGGGLEPGTSTILLGATGTGKSILASLFVSAAARRGEKGYMFVFDETPRTVLARAGAVGIDLPDHARRKRVVIESVSPANISAGEFSSIVRDRVENGFAKVIVVDSLNGYFHALGNDASLLPQLHDLLAYLAAKGVATLLVASDTGMTMPLDLSYLADTVIVCQTVRADGQSRQGIAVLKRRSGDHDRTMREIVISSGGVRVGGIISAQN